MWSVFMSNMTLMQEPCNCQSEVSSWLESTAGSLQLSMWSVFMSDMTLMVPQYLIWNRYLMVSPYLIWNRYRMVPLHLCMVSPHMYDMIFSGQLRKSPLRVLIIVKVITDKLMHGGGSKRNFMSVFGNQIENVIICIWVDSLSPPPPFGTLKTYAGAIKCKCT